MCGIFAYTGIENDAAQKILQGLKTLEYRGYDSWGIAVIDDNKIKIEKKIGKIGTAHTSLSLSTIGIGHTRWATHGGVTHSNAHPHSDSFGNISIVHNGIVENYQELKTNLIEKKHIFKSETDSEVISHVLEEYKNNTFIQALCNTFKKLVGSNGICVLNKKDNTIGVCRNGSPLIIGIGNACMLVSSDITALLPYTNRIIFLNDGEGAVITNKKVSVFDINTGKKIQPLVETVDLKAESIGKKGYPDCLIKEITEQKTIISRAFQLNTIEISTLSTMINNGYKVVITGCGTASYCGIAAQYYFAQHGIDVRQYGAYESDSFKQSIDEKTIMIAISQSGETADTLITIKEAKKKGAFITAIVNTQGSTLERLADIVLTASAGPEIAVVSTKAFTAQLATLYKLVYTVAGHTEKAEKNIQQLEKQLKKWMNSHLENQLQKLAHTLLTVKHLYIIRKGLNYPAAMEASLKIKEVSYIHSEAFAAGELKHGVIALIENETPCICLTSKDAFENEVLSSAMELKSRGGFIIGFGPSNSNVFDKYIETPNCGDLTIFANIIATQLLAYYLGIEKGNDVDKPRNLAKSVTVK